MMAVADESQTEKKAWEGSVTDQLRAPVDAVWDLVSDFVNVDRWLPGLTSTLAVGVAGEPGAVRKVKVHGYPTYVYERLVTLDPDNHSIVYVVEDNNLKLKDYKAEIRLTNGSVAGTTCIFWGFKMSPDSDKAMPALIESRFRIGIQALKSILDDSASPAPDEVHGGNGSKLPLTAEDGRLQSPPQPQPLGLDADEEPLVTSEVEKLRMAP